MLNGKTIAITRSKDDASEFISLAQQNNATPIPLPTIELVSKGEKIVDELESGELSLEKSLKIFEEGIKLSSLCQKTLTLAEQKIQILKNLQIYKIYKIYKNLQKLQKL